MGCQELETLAPDAAQSAQADAGQASGIDAVETQHMAIAEFVGHFDPESGEMSIEMVDADQWEVPDYWVDANTDTRFRSVPQALWCERELGRNSGDVRINTVAGSIGASLAACGVPDNFITAGQGALCANVQLSAPNGQPALVNPVAEILEVTTGYEPWTYLETDGIIGVDPAIAVGNGAPDPYSAFGYPTITANNSARATWAFRNPGNNEEVSFEGRLLVQIVEVCNGVDDDCDGDVDELAGCVELGNLCSDDLDCDSGNCDGGVCAVSLCADGLRNGTETDLDCGGACAPCADTLDCNVDGDCASDHCFRNTCVPHDYPGVGQVIFTEIHGDSGVSAESDFEWFEMTNVSTETLQLDGCVITDSEQQFVINGLTIAPGQYQVFARELDPQDPAHDDLWTNHFLALGGSVYPYAAGPQLADGGDDLNLICPNATTDHVVDTMEYTSDLLARRVSVQVHPGQLTAAGNSAFGNLCLSNESYFPGYLGTPGAANTSCDVVITECEMSGTRVVGAPQGTSGTFSALVMSPGLTDTTAATEEAGPRFLVELGYGPVDVDPFDDEEELWTWIPAAADGGWNDTAAPGFDQYAQVLTASGEVDDTVAVAFRASGNNGGSYVNCSGQGSLTVIPPVGPVEAVGDVIITEFLPNPGSSGDSTGEWFEVYNTTARPLQLQGCEMRDAGSDSFFVSSSVVIFPGEYAVFAKGSSRSYGPPGVVAYDYPTNWSLGNSGDEIVIECNIGGNPTVIDSLYYGNEDSADYSRQVDPSVLDSVGNDAYDVRCDASDASAFSVSGGDFHYGTPGAANTPCYQIGFCRTHAPDDLLNVTGGSTFTVSARLGVPGQSEGGSSASSPLLVGQVGVGPDNSNPSTDDTGWTWTDAARDTGYNSGAADYEYDYDEWDGTVSAPVVGGPFDVAYRFSSDSGDTWKYCDRNVGPGSDGTEDGYNPLNALEMTIAPVFTITDCTMEPGTDVTTLNPGAEALVDMIVTIPGATEGPTQHPSVVVQHAFGADGTDPSTWSDWQVPALSDTEHSITSDYYLAAFEVPRLSATPYDHAFRVSGDSGGSWTYCDTNGGATYETADAAALVPKPWVLPYCAAFTGPPTAEVGDDVNVSLQFYQSGLTNRTGDADVEPDFLVQFGIGSDRANGSAYTWSDASPLGGVGADDVYDYTFEAPAEGVYGHMFRLSGDNGASWRYCSTFDQFQDSVISVYPDGLTTTAPVAGPSDLPYVEDFSGQDGKGVWGGGSPHLSDLSGVDWTIDDSNDSLYATTDWLKVRNGVLESRDTNAPITWYSPVINTSGNFDLSVSFTKVGGLQSSDTLDIEYQLNGTGPWLSGGSSNPTSSSAETLETTGITGTSIRIRLTFDTDGSSDYYRVSSVRVDEAP